MDTPTGPSSSPTQSDANSLNMYGLVELVDRFLENSGRLNSTKHQLFWDTLDTTEGACQYTAALFCKILSSIQYISGKEISILELVKNLAQNLPPTPSTEPNYTPRSMSVTSEDLTIINGVWCTLYYIALFYAVDPEHHLIKPFMDSWQMFLEDRRNPVVLEEFKSVTRLFNVAYSESPELANLLFECTEVPDQLMCDPFDTHPASLSSSMIYVFMKWSLIRLHQNKNILERLLLMLRKHPNKTPRRVSIMLHMIKYFMMTNPQTSTDLVLKAIDHTRPYYLWPSPHGDIAKDLLKMLSVENKMLGSTLRKSMLQDDPKLVIGYNGVEDSDVYVFVDTSVPLAVIFQEFIKSNASTSVPLHEIQLDMLNHIITLNLPDAAAIEWEKLSEDDVSKFLKLAMRIQEGTLEVDASVAASFLKKKLESLYDGIVASIPSQKPMNVTPKPLQRRKLRFHFISITPDNKPPSTTAQLDSSTKISKRSTTEALIKILCDLPPKDLHTSRFRLRLMIVGGDALLQNVAAAFTQIRTSPVEVIAGKVLVDVDPHLFYVPCGYGTLGSYLSRRDPWYASHVCTLTVAVSKVMPTVQTTTLSSEPISISFKSVTGAVDLRGSVRSSILSTGKATIKPPKISDTNYNDPKITPATILFMEMENYVREATERVEIHLYYVECTTVDSLVYNVPFIKGVEIGFRAHLKIAEDEVSQGITKDKQSKYLAPNISIKNNILKINGQPYKEQKLDFQYYHVVMATSIPSSNSPLNSSDPTKPWLELRAIDAEKRHKNKPTSKDLEIPCVVAHTSSVDLEARAGTHFMIVIDDVLYGPLHKARLRIVGGEEHPMTLPFMSYLPSLE